MSALLLDTHTFIWFSENAPNLSVTLKDSIGKPHGSLLFHITTKSQETEK